MANHGRNDIDFRSNERVPNGQGDHHHHHEMRDDRGPDRPDFYQRAESGRMGRGGHGMRGREPYARNHEWDRDWDRGGESDRARMRGHGDVRQGEDYRGSRGEMGYGRSGGEMGPGRYGDPSYGADWRTGGQHEFDRARMRTLDGDEHGARGSMRRESGHHEREHGLLGRLRRWRRSTPMARDVMTRNVRTARPTDTVQQIAQIMVDEDCGIVPIVEEGNRLVGVVTDRDIVCRLIARGVDMKQAKASDVMTDDVECVTEQDNLHDVLRLMAQHQIRRVPVVGRGDRLVGIIATADIAREADMDEELQDTFEDISADRGFWARLR